MPRRNEAVATLLEDMRDAVAVARRAGVEPRDVRNTLPLPRLLALLGRRRAKARAA